MFNILFCYNEKIICLLVFGKISSSFNDVGYLPGHALDQRHQVLISQSSQPRASWWPPWTLGCWLWTVYRFCFFIQIHQFLSASEAQHHYNLHFFRPVLAHILLKDRKTANLVSWLLKLKKKTHIVQMFVTTYEINRSQLTTKQS